MHLGLGAYGLKIRLCAIEGADFNQSEAGVTGGDGFKGEGAEASLPADADGSWRTLGSDGD